MTRLRQIALGGLAAFAIGGAVSSALAEESGSFQNRLGAATIGLPLGALPPPGLYTGLETAFLGMPQSIPSTGTFLPGAGAGLHLSLPAIANAVPLLFVPGWSFLGASYGMSVVQAFYNNNTCTAGLGSCTGAGFFGSGNNAIQAGSGYVTANTTFNPITLSWNLGGGWFVSGSFNFMAPDGTRSSAVLTTPNPDYWTLEPAFAISYLSGTWNITGNFFYDINGPTQGHCCVGAAAPSGVILPGLGETSGNLFYGDLHALYKMGKWSFGPVGAFEFQTTDDTGSACTNAVSSALGVCNRFGYAQIGGLVGYDFGPVDLQVWVTDGIWSQNAAGGAGTIEVYTRLGFKLWGPEAPKPLVAKN
jgi:hypothetical protein